jgi:hypothetical protein
VAAQNGLVNSLECTGRRRERKFGGHPGIKNDVFSGDASVQPARRRKIITRRAFFSAALRHDG